MDDALTPDRIAELGAGAMETLESGPNDETRRCCETTLALIQAWAVFEQLETVKATYETERLARELRDSVAPQAAINWMPVARWARAKIVEATANGSKSMLQYQRRIWDLRRQLAKLHAAIDHALSLLNAGRTIDAAIHLRLRSPSEVRSRIT